MQKITPFLWFDDKAEEAVNLYTSIFKNSKILKTSRFKDAGPERNENVMTISFELFGLQFTAMNAGPHFKFNEAVSFVIDCESQEEIDYYWNALIKDGGIEQPCGWLKDKFGLSWQVVPRVLPQLLGNPDPKKSKKAMDVMMKMKKLNIKELQDAAA